MPDWLLELLWQIPLEEQYQVFSRLDNRSRFDAVNFAAELIDLREDLIQQQSQELKLQAFASYLCNLNPAIAPEIAAFQKRAEQAQLAGMRSAMIDGFDLSSLGRLRS